MDSQKSQAKKYSFLNGTMFNLYIGRVPCAFKHIEMELSLTGKSNQYGDYEQVELRLKKTHYNGKRLLMEFEEEGVDKIRGVLRPFELSNDQIASIKSTSLELSWPQ